jgi:hypothetical protein
MKIVINGLVASGGVGSGGVSSVPTETLGTTNVCPLKSRTAPTGTKAIAARKKDVTPRVDRKDGESLLQIGYPKNVLWGGGKRHEVFAF